MVTLLPCGFRVRSNETLLLRLGFAGHDVDALWDRMAHVINKTLMVALPANVHEYRVSRRISTDPSNANEKPSACFAIYGFDIFLDQKLKPYVIEVNRSPSFTCDSQLDRDIKYGVICNVRLLSAHAHAHACATNHRALPPTERAPSPLSSPSPLLRVLAVGVAVGVHTKGRVMCVCALIYIGMLGVCASTHLHWHAGLSCVLCVRVACWGALCVVCWHVRRRLNY